MWFDHSIEAAIRRPLEILFPTLPLTTEKNHYRTTNDLNSIQKAKPKKSPRPMVKGHFKQYSSPSILNKRKPGGIIKIEAGNDYSFFIEKLSGRVFACGNNLNNNLGFGSGINPLGQKKQIRLPLATGLEGVENVATDTNSTIMWSNQKSLYYYWGSNLSHKLGVENLIVSAKRLTLPGSLNCSKKSDCKVEEGASSIGRENSSEGILTYPFSMQNDSKL